MRYLALAAATLASGCQGERTQSALHPAGPAAAEIAWLWWLLFTLCTTYFVLVMILVLIAIFRRPREQSPPPYGGWVFIITGGIAVPAVILLVMLFASLGVSTSLRMPETALTVRAVGHRWWWGIEYPEQKITTANEIHIPVGEPVRLELTAADVIHSFWVPRLTGKMDLLPGRTTHFWIEAERPGVFRGQCAEFCGLQHALMAFVVVALPPEEFAQWAAKAREPRMEPVAPRLRHGQAVFFRAGCGSCHAIKGTKAAGQIGPDLTHFGSRLTIGAGTLPNNYGNLAGWIANPQALKPGVNMPPTYIGSEDLHTLVEYMLTLK